MWLLVSCLHLCPVVHGPRADPGSPVNSASCRSPQLKSLLRGTSHHQPSPSNRQAFWPSPATPKIARKPGRYGGGKKFSSWLRMSSPLPH